MKQARISTLIPHLSGGGAERVAVNLKATRLLGALFPLMQYLSQSRPAALLTCMWPLAIIAHWARTLSQVPTRVFVAEHTTWSRDKIVSSLWGRWKVANTMRYMFPGADGIITVSNGAADDPARFANLDRKAVTVIHNSIAGDARTRACGSLVSDRFKTRPIYIGNDVWIGCKAIVLRGAYMGYRSVIGARALVKSRILNDMLAVGVPARVVKRIESGQ